MNEDDIEIEEFDVITCVRLGMQNTLPGIDLADATHTYLQESLVMDIMEEGVPEDVSDAQKRFSELIMEVGSEFDEDDIRCVDCT